MDVMERMKELSERLGEMDTEHLKLEVGRLLRRIIRRTGRL